MLFKCAYGYVKSLSLTLFVLGRQLLHELFEEKKLVDTFLRIEVSRARTNRTGYEDLFLKEEYYEDLLCGKEEVYRTYPEKDLAAKLLQVTGQKHRQVPQVSKQKCSQVPGGLGRRCWEDRKP